jgi:predicted SPOUT superfamily RNA methylase MTH1
METPQYLRKRLFKLKPELQFVGILPPLRTPHHPLNRMMKNLKVGEYREGVTSAKTDRGMLVDIGVEQQALIVNEKLPIGRRLTTKIVRVDKQIEAELVNRDDAPDYWGYTVTIEKRPLGKMVKIRGFDLTIATSKHGVPLADVAPEIVEEWRKATTILVAFGAPARGLYEIAEDEEQSLDDIADLVVNTIPMQGTETVRTEEAIIASLAILNAHFSSKA